MHLFSITTDIFINDGKIAAIIENEQTSRQDKASNIQQSGARKFDA